MVRVLTNSQETIDDLLTNGAYIYIQKEIQSRTVTFSTTTTGTMLKNANATMTIQHQNAQMKQNVDTAPDLTLQNLAQIYNSNLSVTHATKHIRHSVISVKHDWLQNLTNLN